MLKNPKIWNNQIKFFLKFDLYFNNLNFIEDFRILKLTHGLIILFLKYHYNIFLNQISNYIIFISLTLNF